MEEGDDNDDRAPTGASMRQTDEILFIFFSKQT